MATETPPPCATKRTNAHAAHRCLAAWMLLAAALILPSRARAQVPTDAWFEPLRMRATNFWMQQAGPLPGLQQLGANWSTSRLELGGTLHSKSAQAWVLPRIPINAKRIQSASVGLGWDGRRMHVLGRFELVPHWTVTVQPTAGLWTASWRQLQSSGWIVAAQIRQDLRRNQTEWTVGLERDDLALYATSLGRWTVAYRRAGLRVSIGGGATPNSWIGYSKQANP